MIKLLAKMSQGRTERGFTLVELMIVVAIIGILAALGSLAWTRYIKQAKMTRLETYVMAVQRAQEQFKSRQGFYYPGDATVKQYTSDQADFQNLLEFNQTLEEGVEIFVMSGDAGQGCGDCQGSAPDTARAWHYVRLEYHFNPGGDPTQIVLHSDLPSPMRINEGE